VGIQLALQRQRVNVAGGQTGSLGHGFELETAGQRGGGRNSGGMTEREANWYAEA
jgi:hypothetical protein